MLLFKSPTWSSPVTTIRIYMVSNSLLQRMKIARLILRERGLDPRSLEKQADGTLATRLTDPNGHNLLFVEYTIGSKQTKARGQHLGSKRVSDHLQHVGITITNEEASNALYRDALGFEETWRGSRKDGGPDAWVNMQTPGNRGDYVEYILINDMKPTRKQLGTMHHVCFSTNDIHKAHSDMLSNALPDHKRYKPRIGRSKRWLFMFATVWKDLNPASSTTHSGTMSRFCLFGRRH